MTLADLQNHVWQRLGLRKHFAGRATVDDLTRLVVENWQSQYLSHAHDDYSQAIVCHGIAVAVKRSHQWQSGREPREYGMLWSLILGSVVSAVISTVLRWWLERRSNRVMLAVWQHELTGGEAA